MIIYWLIFLIPAFVAVAPHALTLGNRKVQPELLPWLLVALVLILTIGLRHEVGGDWVSYLGHVDYAREISVIEVIVEQKDPAYAVLNWIGANVNGGVYFVNIFCGALFSWGLIAFCRAQNRPWLALVVAIPYLVIVVAMGYTRQSVALGITMLGFVALQRENIWRFLLCIAVAALFHKSAIIVVPLAMFSTSRNKWLVLPAMVVLCLLLFFLLVKESLDILVENYIAAEYSSSGAMIRVVMNALPSCIYLIGRRRIKLLPSVDRFWTWMSWIGIAFIAILQISPSSTAVDRIALYWIPLQVFAWSRLPDVIHHRKLPEGVLVLAVVIYSAFVLHVWMNYADNSFSWLPYKFYPLESE